MIWAEKEKLSSRKALWGDKNWSFEGAVFLHFQRGLRILKDVPQVNYSGESYWTDLFIIIPNF